jgi:hypothetical protein
LEPWSGLEIARPNAQLSDLRRWLGERASSTDSVEEPLQPNEGKERGDDDQYWAR